MRTIVWFRGKDLRLADHEPLLSAMALGDVIPLFVLDPEFFAPARAKKLPHRIQFLLDALQELERSIAARGSRLLILAGKSVDVVPAVAKRWRADRVVAYRWVEPFGRERDRRISQRLGERFVLYEGETLMPPGTLRSGSGNPYSVFSQFARSFLAQQVNRKRPVSAPETLPPPPAGIRASTTPVPTCEQLGLTRNPQVLAGGEAAAAHRLELFVRAVGPNYSAQRDRMDQPGTSRLSADLKFGTLSVRQVWHAIETQVAPEGAAPFLRQLIWREFTHSTLWDRPNLLTRPFKVQFADFPWLRGGPLWRAWVEGRTGYPVVDAACRQLLGEGFVHNRARMISASFLTKHLLLHYRLGERHYMKYLTDGDWAQNNAGWQWSAGCGCDAQPYFRVFNPMLQGKRFDPEGHYVRQWVPELADMPTRFVHAPWEAPEAVLQASKVRLGDNYPRPVVDHRFARERFLTTAARHLKGRPMPDQAPGREPSTSSQTQL